jgi:hypothetical protein
MQPIDLSHLVDELIRKVPKLSLLLHGANYSNYLQPDDGAPDAASDKSDDYASHEEDTRENINRSIKMRRGQKEFRRHLRTRYGDMCLISGCSLVDLLEAAHIRPYRGTQYNHVKNGLLLRADLHTLFDLDLLGIEPDTLIVRLHPRARGGGYEAFDGVQLRCTEGCRPSRSALRRRWTRFERQDE